MRARRWPFLLGALLLSACSPGGPSVRAPVPPKPPPKGIYESFPCKRVDSWRFVGLDLPPTPVEEQLGKYFEGVFPHARLSPAYTCVARENVAFLAQYDAAPDESLNIEMIGRCGAPVGGQWRTVDIPSDGTVLDNPLSSELLASIAKDFGMGPVPFNTFGITARYDGPTATVFLEGAMLDGSMQVGEPDRQGRVRVQGELLDDQTFVRARINQGELGAKVCEADPTVDLPHYAVTCRMAADDDEAWIEVMASRDTMSWQHLVGQLPVRKRGSVGPEEYRRKRLNLPSHSDPARSLVTFINESREQLGLKEVDFAREQSSAIQPIYDEIFDMNLKGNWLDDTKLREEIMKGSAVHGAISSAHVVTGIAFDGDAADWLAFRLKFPGGREDLLDPQADAIAFAGRTRPGVGFGALAALYSLFTPERERSVADAIASRIAKVRAKHRSRRLPSPRELEEAGRKVAAGHDTPDEAFASALRGLNLASKKKAQFYDGVFLDLPGSWPAFDVPHVLLGVDELQYGIVVTHHKYPGDSWARAVAFVWFIGDGRAGKRVENGRPADAHVGPFPPG